MESVLLGSGLQKDRLVGNAVIDCRLLDNVGGRSRVENLVDEVVSEPLSLPRLVCHTLEEGEPKIRRY